MRRRWAAAAVLLAWALLHLVAARPPGLGEPVADRDTAAISTVITATVAVAVESAGEPCPREGDPSPRQVAARSPRTAGTVGTGDGTAARAPARTDAAWQDGKYLRPPGPRGGPGADETSSGGPESRTYRC
ncbi:hypothetical protein GCM10022384_39820 [Streptomyces marokkonensis]|uniref:Secreted protein n=1 Tax=Streptomyces marokkonensis TaxID=324855 RepID=A0ABP7QTP4_9ACTN